MALRHVVESFARTIERAVKLAAIISIVKRFLMVLLLPQ